MNKHIDIIRTNTDDMVILAECNLLEKENEELKQALLDIKEYIETNQYDKEITLLNKKYYSEYFKNKILDIVNKALRGEE